MKLLEVHTLPIWEENDGTRRPPQPGEVRDDLPCVGWANAGIVEIQGSRRWLLLTHDAAE